MIKTLPRRHKGTKFHKVLIFFSLCFFVYLCPCGYDFLLKQYI